MSNDDENVVRQDVVADGKEVIVNPPKHIQRKRGGKFYIKDTIVVDHYCAATGKHHIHTCNSGLLHRFLVKIGRAHNSLNAQGIADIAQWIGGLSSPTLYGYLGIGTETSVDTQTDTYNSNEASVLMIAITPTVSTTTLTNDTLTWTHVFSHANDASLSGTSNIQEVIVGTAAATWRTLIHVSGSNYQVSPDVCNWNANDTLTITVICQVEQGT